MDKKSKTSELVKQPVENEGVNDVVGLQSILQRRSGLMDGHKCCTFIARHATRIGENETSKF